MGKLQKKGVTIVLIDEHGKAIQKPVTCPTCGKKVSFIDSKTVYCKKCGQNGRKWDIKSLAKTLRKANYKKEFSFTKI